METVYIKPCFIVEQDVASDLKKAGYILHVRTDRNFTEHVYEGITIPINVFNELKLKYVRGDVYSYGRLKRNIGD